MEHTGNSYSVYIHITPNNKKYIGITKNAPTWRWRNGSGYSRLVFGNAIKKYGWNNIQHHIVATNLSLKEAEAMEVALISFFKTTNPKYGYNVSLGGHIGLQEASPEFKERLRIATTGANNHKSIPVRCVETGEVFESIHLAAKHYNVTSTGILRVLKGRNKKTGGLTFEVVKEKDEKIKIKTLTKEEVAAISRKSVAVYDKEGHFIEVCQSRTEAAKKYGTTTARVSNCIKGWCKTANGFYFYDASGKVSSIIRKKDQYIGAKNPSARAIDQYDLQGNFIKHYEYSTLAAKEVEADLSSIIKCCRGKQKTCAGSTWKYSNA